MAGSPRARKTGDQFFAAAAVSSPPAWGATANDAPTATPHATTATVAGTHSRSANATIPAATKSAAAISASSWLMPNVGTSQNAVTNVPTMLPQVETEKSLPAVRPSSATSGARSRTAIGVTAASRTLDTPKSRIIATTRIEARARIPAHDELEHAVVEHGNQQHADRAEQDHADEQRRPRRAVGDGAAQPRSRSPGRRGRRRSPRPRRTASCRTPAQERGSTRSRPRAGHRPRRTRRPRSPPGALAPDRRERRQCFMPAKA